MTFKTTNILQESSDKSVIELQQYAKKNKPNLHILNKLQEEMKKLATQRVRIVLSLSVQNVLLVLYKILWLLYCICVPGGDQEETQDDHNGVCPARE